MKGWTRNVEILGLLAGFGLWGLAFIVLYAGHGLACGVGVRPGHYDGVTRIALGSAFIAFVAAHAWLARWLWQRLQRPEEKALRFIRLISFALAMAALATTIWTGFPVLTLTICS